MRNFLVSLIAIIVLVCMATPLMADTSSDSDVYVTVDECMSLETCENDILFHVTCDTYLSGPDATIVPYNAGGSTTVTVHANLYWNLTVCHDAYTNGMPSNWLFECSTAESGDPWVTITEAGVDLLTNQAPVDEFNEHYYYHITGINLEDDWVGDNHPFTVTYSVSPYT